MMQHRKPPKRRPAPGTTHSEQLGANSTPTSLSEVCSQYGVPGFLCSCDLAATAISTAGKDVCTYQPFEAACPDKYDEMCEGTGGGDGGLPPGYEGGQQASFGTWAAFAVGTVALGAAGAYYMDE